MQCVESKLYAYIPLFPKIGVSLQWRGTVEVENAAMALVQKSSSSSAVVTTLDGGQTVQRMLLNLGCAPDQELFNQGVYVLLALLESSLWSVKKNNPFNCLLIIASVSSLSKIFDLGPLGSEFHEATGSVRKDSHAPWESSWLYSLFCSFWFRLPAWTSVSAMSQIQSRVGKQRETGHQLFLSPPLLLMH